MRIPETSQNTVIAPACQCGAKRLQPDEMAALDALLKRLEINTTPRRTENAVVVHHSSGPMIMSVNQSYQNINDTTKRIHATFDRIDVLLGDILETSKQILEMTKELLRIFKQPGFVEAMNAKKRARIEDVKTEAHA